MSHFPRPPRDYGDRDGRGPYSDLSRHVPYPPRASSRPPQYPPIRPSPRVYDVPPPRETVTVPPFSRGQMESAKELILLEARPISRETTDDHVLTELIQQSIQNQEKFASNIKKLADVLGRSGEALTGCWEAFSVSREAQSARTDVDVSCDFTRQLNENLTDSPMDFFPPKE